MKPALPGLVALAGLLLVPFALQPPSDAAPRGAARLVLLTSHNEAIRHEMSRGFQRYRAQRHSPPIELDWRSPGGTAEISRYLGAEYRAAFAQYFRGLSGQRLSERASMAFDNPRQTDLGEDESALARRLFLASNVGIKIDILFGGGSYDFSQHAAAGRLVDSGMLAKHPELFGERGIPQSLGGEPYWDKQGRWLGTCVSGFGICYNPEELAKLGVSEAPTRWSDLANPRLAGRVALADPSKSGSANKAFEMLVQQTMNEAVQRAVAAAPGSASESAALALGFDAGLRLIRRIGGVSRYFSDQAGKVAQDVQSGSAAAGMCIDFYGRFATDRPGPAQRMRFVLPEGGSSWGADPIALLRGAPSPEVAKDFIEFVLSPQGQALWAYKRGVEGGPERYALRRTPILPSLFDPVHRVRRSDPEDNPYVAARGFTYHAAWTGPLFRGLAFVVKVMCVDTEDDLHEAAAALVEHRDPPLARAAFDDVSLVSYAVVKGEIAPTLAAGDPVRELRLQNRLVRAVRAHYQRVTQLAESGQ